MGQCFVHYDNVVQPVGGSCNGGLVDDFIQDLAGGRHDDNSSLTELAVFSNVFKRIYNVVKVTADGDEHPLFVGLVADSLAGVVYENEGPLYEVGELLLVMVDDVENALGTGLGEVELFHQFVGLGNAGGGLVDKVGDSGFHFSCLPFIFILFYPAWFQKAFLLSSTNIVYN